jgi:exodeoxyribonuclease VII large subunit
MACMARRTTSQWEFSGDLFGAAKPAAKPAREVVSVGDFTRRIREVLEGQFGTVWVRGEISNFRMQASGHAYFVLKDGVASVNCVLFRGQTGVSRALLRDGASVIVGGAVTVYEPRGQYQLRVTHVEAEGIGALQAAFEELKRKLAAEGLFEAGRKRPLPAFPRGIGIVTSPTGAALRDVLHVIGRRFAGLTVVVAPARVQGQGAAREIAEGIQLLNEWSATTGALDVVLVTRGGGSLEDLWAFNEEVVARAIAASELPVVSAVGHEIDFTISDFVADLRAATPSAAAEILTAGYVASRERVAELALRFPRWVRAILSGTAEGVEDLQRRLGRMHPRRRLEEHAQRMDDLADGLRMGVLRALRERRRQGAVLGQRLMAARPSARLVREGRAQLEIRRRLLAGARRGLMGQRDRLARIEDRLRLLSPAAVLERGYSITLDAVTGKVVRDAATVGPGRRLESRLARGRITSVVEDAQA